MLLLAGISLVITYLMQGGSTLPAQAAPTVWHLASAQKKTETLNSQSRLTRTYMSAGLQGAHVVQAVSKFDDQNSNVLSGSG